MNIEICGKRTKEEGNKLEQGNKEGGIMCYTGVYNEKRNIQERY
jgi:hypothetical protein